MIRNFMKLLFAGVGVDIDAHELHFKATHTYNVCIYTRVNELMRIAHDHDEDDCL